MQIAFCENCGKHTGHKRAIGAGTALGALCTSGLSLLAVPAYGKRCVVCGLTVDQAHAVNPAVQQKLEATRELSQQRDADMQDVVVRGVGRVLGWLVALPYYAAKRVVRAVRK